jgi:hypothetical protein
LAIRKKFQRSESFGRDSSGARLLQKKDSGPSSSKTETVSFSFIIIHPHKNGDFNSTDKTVTFENAASININNLKSKLGVASRDIIQVPIFTFNKILKIFF